MALNPGDGVEESYKEYREEQAGKVIGTGAGHADHVDKAKFVSVFAKLPSERLALKKALEGGKEGVEVEFSDDINC